MLIGDVHYGVAGSLLPELDNYLTKKDKESKILILGDMVDNALVASVGDVYEQVKNPNKSFEQIESFLKKYKDRILVVISGNHEHRTRRVAGIDILEMIMRNLEIPYTPNSAIVDVSVKTNHGYGSRHRYNYVFALHHGVAGGRYPEKSTRQGRWFQDKLVGVDAYIMGHTHSGNVTPLAQEIYDRRNKSVYKRTLYYITISSFVEDEYAERKLLRPPAYNLFKIRCYGDDRRKLEVSTEEFIVNLPEKEIEK